MKISYNKIMSFNPCYNPIEIGMTEDYEANISDFIIEFRNKVTYRTDIHWVLLRIDFMPEKDLRLFAVWCARTVENLMTDQRSINALNVTERYAYGEATLEELNMASEDAWAAYDAARAAARAALAVDRAAYDAAWAAYDAAWAVDRAAWAAARADLAVDRAAYDAAWAAYDAAWAVDRAMWNKQIDKLLDYFTTIESEKEYDWRN